MCKLFWFSKCIQVNRLLDIFAIADRNLLPSTEVYLKKLEYRFYVYFAKKNLWPIVTVVIQGAKNFELIVHGRHGFFFATCNGAI